MTVATVYNVLSISELAAFAAARRNPPVIGIIVPICQTMVWNMLAVLVLPD